MKRHKLAEIHIREVPYEVIREWAATILARTRKDSRVLYLSLWVDIDWLNYDSCFFLLATQDPDEYWDNDDIWYSEELSTAIEFTKEVQVEMELAETVRGEYLGEFTEVVEGAASEAIEVAGHILKKLVAAVVTRLRSDGAEVVAFEAKEAPGWYARSYYLMWEFEEEPPMEPAKLATE